MISDRHIARDAESARRRAELVATDVGRADAAVTGKPAAKLYARNRGTLQVIDKQLTIEEYGYALRKDDPALLKLFNEGLKKVKADGTYQKLVDKYL